MAKLELSRLLLFAAEWVLSVICLALFPSSLYRTTVEDDQHVCAIGSSNFCRFGIAWSLLGVVLVTICIAWHLSEYCSRFALPPLLECLILALLFLWWLAAAVAFSVAKANTDIVDVTSGARKVLRALSWFLVLLFIASSTVAWIILKNDNGDVQPMLGTDPQDHAQGTTYSAYA